MPASGFTELMPPPAGGRVFTQERRPGLGDCAPSGRLRLDALARWLQDVAWSDVDDAGLAGHAVWVVRRTRMLVRRFPRFGERFKLATFCSGLGRMWAERRTTVSPQGSHQADVEAVSLWVHLDPPSRRPSLLTREEIAAYGGAAAGRKVTARLRHRAARSVADGSPWTFRAAECDVAGHVNNAAYWTPLDEELIDDGDVQRIDVELEYRAPAQPGEKLVVSEGDRRWIVDRRGETHASIVIGVPSG